MAPRSSPTSTKLIAGPRVARRLSSHPRPRTVSVRPYNSHLPNPLDFSRYINTGKERKPFMGAIQPRFGFSYSIDKAEKTTIFGGWGLYYDRIQYDLYSVDEAH